MRCIFVCWFVCWKKANQIVCVFLFRENCAEGTYRKNPWFLRILINNTVHHGCFIIAILYRGTAPPSPACPLTYHIYILFAKIYQILHCNLNKHIYKPVLFCVLKERCTLLIMKSWFYLRFTQTIACSFTPCIFDWIQSITHPSVFCWCMLYMSDSCKSWLWVKAVHVQMSAHTRNRMRSHPAPSSLRLRLHQLQDHHLLCDAGFRVWAWES